MTVGLPGTRAWIDGPQERPCPVEHALAYLKSWNILRNCRRKADGVWFALRGVVLMRNLAMAG